MAPTEIKNNSKKQRIIQKEKSRPDFIKTVFQRWNITKRSASWCENKLNTFGPRKNVKMSWPSDEPLSLWCVCRKMIFITLWLSSSSIHCLTMVSCNIDKSTALYSQIDYQSDYVNEIRQKTKRARVFGYIRN